MTDREKEILENTSLVWMVIHKSFGFRDDKQDLFQVGCLGLIKAVDSFNPDLGFKKSTYYASYIRYEILHYMRSDHFVYVPRKDLESGDYPRDYDGYDSLLNEENGSSVPSNHLSDLDAPNRWTESLSIQQGLQTLTSIEQQVMDLYFFQDFNQASIAKIIGISQASVSRILKRSLEKLKKYV